MYIPIRPSIIKVRISGWDMAGMQIGKKAIIVMIITAKG